MFLGMNKYLCIYLCAHIPICLFIGRRSAKKKHKIKRNCKESLCWKDKNAENEDEAKGFPLPDEGEKKR